MESQRQKKISALIQKDISNIIQGFFRDKTRANLIVSITKVTVSPDLSVSKIYLSVFPSANFSKVIDILNKSKSGIRKKLSSLLKHQLRVIPDILFFTDDSLDYIDKIDEALKGGGENPIK
tara:strand:+ start:157 stop:519 length:363 start_codon:yes stop_codon:yes gene_type:complete